MTIQTQSNRERWRMILAEEPVIPSPMCGISDFAFRTVCREKGAQMAYTQMVSAEALVRHDRKTIDILDLHAKEPILGIQVFGNDPERLAEAGAIAESMGADLVDLNMGCPARRVTSGRGGSALLREPELCGEIFKAMRAALEGPFTVKMRWDWDEEVGSSLEIARRAEDEGVDGLCLHARTRSEAYKGHADWDRIRQLKACVSIPVVGNGDVRSPEDATRMMNETGCDGVMIGRGAIGNPWLVGDALDAVKRSAHEGPPDATDAANSANGAPLTGKAPSWEALREMMLRHVGLMCESRGERRGVILFRKHAAQYVRGIRGVKQIRPKLMRVETLEGLAELLSEFSPETWPEIGAEKPLENGTKASPALAGEG